MNVRDRLFFSTLRRKNCAALIQAVEEVERRGTSASEIHLCTGYSLPLIANTMRRLERQGVIGHATVFRPTPNHQQASPRQ